jgi:hypothetical protein
MDIVLKGLGKMEKQNERKAVVFLSGGLETTTVLPIAQHERFEILTFSFDYVSFVNDGLMLSNLLHHTSRQSSKL